MSKKVSSLLCLIILLTFNVIDVWGQTRQLNTSKDTGARLLYIIDSNSVDYMLPYIEQKLKNLRFANSERKLFDDVASLNTLSTSNKIEGTIITNLIENNSLASIKKQHPEAEAKYQTYFDYIKDFQSILLIKTNQFKDLIEFQFTLYERDIKNNSLHYKASASVFINPEKPHYQSEIIRTLEEVFTTASSELKFTIASNIQPVDNIYYISPKDSIYFDPVVNDTGPEDDRIYFWSQDLTKQANVLPINRSIKRQALHNLQPGSYILNFSYTNGINNSTLARIKIKVYTPPVVEATYEGSGAYYFPGDNQLITQRYIFSKYSIRLDSKMSITTNKSCFFDSARSFDAKPLAEEPLKFSYNITNETGKSYLHNKNVVALNDGSYKLDNILGNEKDHILTDDEHNKIGHLPLGQYFLIFQGHTDEIKSDTLKQDLLVFRRSPISFLVEASVFPLANLRPANATSYWKMGFNARLSSIVSVNCTEWSNVSQTKTMNAFSTFYSNVLINADEPNNNFGVGAGLLLPNSRSPQAKVAFGGRFYVKLLNRFNGDFGMSFDAYSTSDSKQKILGLSLYDSFFF